MNAGHYGLNIICKTPDKEYELICLDYYESITEINVKTQIKESELQRGWIGDLYYSTIRSIDILTGDDTESKAENTHRDVLLARVDIYSVENGIVTWEYTFLKK